MKNVKEIVHFLERDILNVECIYEMNKWPWLRSHTITNNIRIGYFIFFTRLQNF